MLSHLLSIYIIIHYISKFTVNIYIYIFQKTFKYYHAHKSFFDINKTQLSFKCRKIRWIKKIQLVIVNKINVYNYKISVRKFLLVY